MERQERDYSLSVNHENPNGHSGQSYDNAAAETPDESEHYYYEVEGEEDGPDS